MVAARRRSRQSSAAVFPGGGCQEQARVFSGGFPHLVKEFIPSHLISVIPTAGGEASVAAVQAADRGRRGGSRTGSQGLTAVVRVRAQATLRTRCAGLGPLDQLEAARIPC